MNKQNITSTITLKDKVVAHHISGGSKLTQGICHQSEEKGLFENIYLCFP